MEIIITKKPIRTLRMSIKPDWRVLVSAPKSYSDAAIQKRITSKQSRIDSILQRLEKKKPQLKENERQLLWEIYTIDVQPNNNTVTVDTKTKKIVTPNYSEIKPFFRAVAKKLLTKKITSRATLHGCVYEKLFIRSQTTKRWTCSSKKHISLNRKLITFPERIIDYVICHELAHLKHMNHSKQFRDHCIALYPKTKEAKKWMKQEGFMIE
jgi:predicted metal-dependent hydrolase